MVNKTNDITDLINRFNLASRGLFNQYFRVPDSYNNDGWLCEQRFSEVQSILFTKLVSEPASLSIIKYGLPQSDISIEIRHSNRIPALINREQKSGYWDFPVKEITKSAKLVFIDFFDWDQLALRDNRYTRVMIDSWEEHPETDGKQVLIESYLVRYVSKRSETHQNQQPAK